MTDLRIRKLVRETLRSPATNTQPELLVRKLVREVLRSPAADNQPELGIRELVRECLHSPRGPATPHVKKAKFTVQSSKVTGSSISNFVVFLTEQHLPASIFSSTYGARTDGGDLRAYSNSAAVAEYPIDVVIFDKASSKALICVKLPSIGSGANTDFHLFWGWPTLLGYDAGDPNGRWQVWADYSFVAFFNGTTLVADRTSGNRTLTFAGSPTAVDGPYSKATRFNGTTGSMIASSTTVALGTEITLTAVAKRVGNGDANGRIVTARAGAATQGISLNLTTGASDLVSASIYTSGGVEVAFGAHALGSGWNEIVLTSNTVGPAHEIFVGDVSRATNALAVRTTTTAGRVAAASSLATSGNENAQVDIGLILIEPRIDSDRRTTGKSNRDDPGFVETTIEHYSTIDLTQSASPGLDMPTFGKVFPYSAIPTANLQATFEPGGGGAIEHTLQIDVSATAAASITRAIGKLIDTQSGMTVGQVRAIAQFLAIACWPTATLDTGASLSRAFDLETSPSSALVRSAAKSLLISTSPLAQHAHAIGKTIAEQCAMEIALIKAVAATKDLTSSPTSALAIGRLLARTIDTSATATAALTSTIGKVLSLATSPVASYARVLSLIRSVNTVSISSLLLRRDIELELDLETSPSPAMSYTRRLVHTITAGVSAALDVIRGFLQGDAITDRVLRVPPENRIIVLARLASRILGIPAEDRTMSIAREVRMATIATEDRITAIPAEAARVISVPAEDRVLAVPPES